MAPTIEVNKSFFNDLLENIPETALEEIIIKNAEESLENPSITDENQELSFEYTTDNQEELLYATTFIALLEELYQKYQFQPVNYVLENIDEDIQELWQSWIKNLKSLPILFDNTAIKELLDKGILVDNLSKIDLSETQETKKRPKIKKIKLDKIKLNENINPEHISEKILSETGNETTLSADAIQNGLNEQIITLSSIALGLSLGLKSKSYYLLNRKSEDHFNPRSNFKKAFSRLKNTVESAFVSTQSHALRKATIFLFGDPEVYWITRGDHRVCKWCLSIEAASPMKLSRCPFCPLHNHCRCKIGTKAEFEGKSEEEVMDQLTEEAIALTYYSTLQSR